MKFYWKQADMRPEHQTFISSPGRRKGFPTDVIQKAVINRPSTKKLRDIFDRDILEMNTSSDREEEIIHVRYQRMVEFEIRLEQLQY